MPEAGTYTADDLAAECKRLKAALYPQVKEAIAAHPGQKDAIIRLLGLADKHEKGTEFASAIESYHELSALLASLPAAEKTDAATGDPTALFNERLKALLPEVKAAAGTPPGDEAKLKVSEAGVLARKKDFVQANALLDQAEAALKKSAAGTNGDPTALFNERLKALLPEVKAAAGTPPGDEAKLKVSEAGVLARKKDFVQANSLLDQAEAALKISAVGTNGDPAVLFNERLKALLPEVKTAAGTPAGDEAKLKVSEAGVLARKKDFIQANALLDQAEAVLDFDVRAARRVNLQKSRRQSRLCPTTARLGLGHQASSRRPPKTGKGHPGRLPHRCGFRSDSGQAAQARFDP